MQSNESEEFSDKTVQEDANTDAESDEVVEEFSENNLREPETVSLVMNEIIDQIILIPKD